MDQRPMPRTWVAVGSGFAAALVLILAVESYSFRETRRVERDIKRLTYEAERSTYLIGDLGHLLSRLQANVLEALTEDVSAIREVQHRFEDIDGTVQRHLVELPAVLSADERAVWHAVEPEISRQRGSLRRALDLLAAGAGADAEAELDVLARRNRMVFDALRSVLEFNQRETRAQLDAANRLIARTRIAQGSIAMLLFIGTSAIAFIAVRVVRRKDGVITSYVERVERANRDLEAFAGRVAHDLRNVLAPLRYSAHILRASANRPDTVVKTASYLDRVTRAATELILGLLDFSRAGAPPASGAASVDGELELVLEELRPLIDSVGPTIEVDADPALIVRCERALLHIVLLNLVSNAVKFLDGRAARRVRIGARAVAGRCAIVIQDTGPGIPANARERIFEPFFRVPGSTAAGTGIGLATVRRVVESHGGRIEVASEEGAGSRFSVLLPLATEPSMGPSNADGARASADT